VYNVGGDGVAHAAAQAPRRRAVSMLRTLALHCDLPCVRCPALLAPAQFRAIATPSNMPAFAQAFSCKPGDSMVRSADTQVKIW
jgi:hypothetical protein